MSSCAVDPEHKSGWKSAKLADCCTFHNGLWKGKKGPFETATVIRNTNFTASGTIDLTNVAVLEVEAKQLAKRRLQKNDIIIEKSGGGPKQPVGRVVFFGMDDGVYSFSNFTSAIRVNDPKILHPVFLHRVLYWWYVDGRTEALQRRSTGIRNLDFKAYQQLEIPLPPLEEQKRIVAVLDQAFAALDRARANAEANLADAEELYRSGLDALLFERVDDWQSGSFNDLVGEVSTGPFGSLLHKRDYVENETPLVNPANIVDGKIEANLSKTVTREALQRLQSYKLRLGDVVIGRRGEMGRCASVSSDQDGWLCGTGSFFVRPKPGVSSELVAYILRTRKLVSHLTSIASGTTMLNLSNKALGSMDFAMPPLERQPQIVDEINMLKESAKAASNNCEGKIADIDDLRQSILQKAFAGELT